MGNARNIAFWVVLFLLILALFNLFNGGQTAADSRAIPYSDFISRVEAGDVTEVDVEHLGLMPPQEGFDSFPLMFQAIRGELGLPSPARDPG